MGVAYPRTSGRCLRCRAPFMPEQVVVMAHEHLIAEVIGNACVYTTEWVTICPACATVAEQRAATHECQCRGCAQPMLSPASLKAHQLVCSNRCAQRVRRRQRQARRAMIHCGACGSAFRPTRSDARFCSRACKQKAYRLRAACD
jgi:hypothetical protein